MGKLLFTFTLVFSFILFSFIGCDQITLPEFNDPNKEIWFAPNLRSADYLDLFRQPDAWQVARGKVNVFKFYIQQINDSDVEANFENLQRLNAFELLRSWGIKIAFEAGAIKEYSCKQPLISPTARAVTIVKPDYISIDEAHFAANRWCRINLVTASNLIQNYINYFSSMGVKVGLIEPYPSFDVEYLISVVQSLDNLDHFHIDIDFNAVKERGMEKDRVVNDMNRLSAVCKEKGVKFGIIFTGSPLSDNDFSFITTLKHYYTSYSKYIDLDQEIFQSWLLDLPRNVPENEPFTFTWFIKSFP